MKLCSFHYDEVRTSVSDDCTLETRHAFEDTLRIVDDVKECAFYKHWGF